MTRVLVTGATGNVGTALLRRLAREDVSVSGLARRVPAPGRADGSSRDVRWHAVDLASPVAPGLLREAMADVDAVVHCAWRIAPNHDDATLRAVNVGGTTAVAQAARATGVAHLVHLSSVGVYAVGPTRADGTKEAVPEDHPATGIPTSWYSVQKAETERLLDDAASSSGAPVLTTVRPGLVLQAEAGPEIARYFLGPLVPVGAALRAVRRLNPPVLPLPREFQVPVVHADDLADALWRVLDRALPGALNVAAEPGLDADALARAFGFARSVPVPVGAVRALAAATWRARLQPTDAGWVDIAAGVPLQDTTRARTELGWSPQVSAPAALEGLLASMAGGAGSGGGPTPVLRERGALHGRMER